MTDFATTFVEHEARALLTRLARIKPFALSEAMVPAANVAPAAQRCIDLYLDKGRTKLREQGLEFLQWLRETNAAPEEAQRRFSMLRLRFNAVLTQFDLFSDALSQRSEPDHGVWMAGLDALARDALDFPGVYEAPPLLCYLDRGVGAAIRRARTRLPGGGENPAAIIRVPRERMVGGGIASSLVHEVGHQAAALLGLVPSLQPVLQGQRGEVELWRCWERWISEIVADLWSVARLGVAATLGLVGVVSLPRAFVYRISMDDPHPPPWLRVVLSCALGAALYPGPPWARMLRLWQALYPLAAAPVGARTLLARLERHVDDFVFALLQHRPAALHGDNLAQALGVPELRPGALRHRFASWQGRPQAMYAVRPCLACAVLGQARADALIAPETESRWMARLLTRWALDNLLAAHPRPDLPQPV